MVVVFFSCIHKHVFRLLFFLYIFLSLFCYVFCFFSLCLFCFILIKKIFLAFRNVSVRTSFSSNDKRRTKVCWAAARVFGKTWTTDDEPQQHSTTHRKNSQQNPPNTARKKTKQNQTEQHSPLRHALKHTHTHI